MPDVDLIAPLIVRDYAWQVIKNNTSLSESSYDGMNPVIPLSQEPEFVDQDNPFIVYGYIEVGNITQPQLIDGTMTFVIYGKDREDSGVLREIGGIANVLRMAFEEQDESARRINLYSGSKTHFKGKVRFTYTNVNTFGDFEPSESEGGRKSIMIGIDYQYVHHQSIKLPTNASNGDIVWE